MNFSRLAFAALLALGLSITTASASPISFTCANGCHNDAFAGAVWSTDNVFHPSGTGVFQPFLRLQGTGNSPTEDGHNTDAKNQDFLNDEKAGIWTHSVLMTDLTPVTVDGYGSQLFYAFALDYGEPANPKNSFESLDALKLCTANDPSLTMADNCPTQPFKYDLDAAPPAGVDREVLLDYSLSGRGNGASDLFVFIPVFATSDKYLYLYSAFGATASVHGTFAEWSFFDGPGTTAVPEPASMLLLGTGLAGAAHRRRRRKN